jgi:hypothetical protein
VPVIMTTFSFVGSDTSTIYREASESKGRSVTWSRLGDLLGIQASGSPVEMRSIDSWRVEDQLFVEH